MGMIPKLLVANALVIASAEIATATPSRILTLFNGSWYFFSLQLWSFLVMAYFGVRRNVPVLFEKRPDKTFTELLILIP